MYKFAGFPGKPTARGIPRAVNSIFSFQQLAFRMQQAVIWGGMLMVITPLKRMRTQSPTEKQQARQVCTRIFCPVRALHTSRSPFITCKTRAKKV